MAKTLDVNRRLELSTIYEVGKILSSSLDLSKTFREVLNLLSINLDTRRGMISLLQESGELHLIGASGLSADEFKRGRFNSGEGVTGRILQTGMPVVVHDISKEPLFLNRTGSLDEVATHPIAFIGVPIKAGSETIGVLSIDRLAEKQGQKFQDDVQLLTMVANLIGQVVRLNQTVTADRALLLQEQQRLKSELHGKYSLDNVVGYSKPMQEVFAQVHQAAPGNATVLLRGESGTGKEVIARGVHFLSPRKDGPFIKVNCAALTETLLESELFGHEKGAFTGAQAERKGRFEQAHGGTLFLDEIGDISPAFQAKLLRVLQEREFERVGGNRSIKVNVRLITATNRNLEQAVSKGEFRADLYYRINVVSIFLPPLRDRREDIPYLVERFLSKFNQENKRKLTLSPESMQVLVNCYWPGNVRELENCVERTATMARTSVVREVDFPCQHAKCLTQTLHGDVVPIPIVIQPVHAEKKPAITDSASHEHVVSEPVAVSPPSTERERLIWALEQCGWVQAKAARLLNISPRQMGYALLKYNIEVKKF
ncbi:nif-specific transcriptional activator NifA [Sulfuriferula nivalis]|uniref:Nif-specific regulatory protein n=1 Tax=Sulfuriferula nivalis TaxID=2675298 RepID=A0A809SC99_9PROT|nr:nif-specific transcriptional activator NifA [Sulfuriferula nivalis]BBO99746.1 nif-specific regulatory protein [Sulfuriferula nivalis]